MLKLTVAAYMRRSGKNIHRFKNAKESEEWGVKPDKEIKPNRKELAETTRLPVGTDDEVIAAAGRLNASLRTQAVLVSLSDDGLVLVPSQGAPIRVVSEPGLQAKVPLLDTLTYYETRLLTLQIPPEQVILGDQKRIVVEAYARCADRTITLFDGRIVEERLQTPEQAAAQA